MAEAEWRARVAGALNAHFKQPDGGSRPGTDDAVGFGRGAETHRIIVRAYLAEGTGPQTRGDAEYQAQTVVGSGFDRLAAGWSPAAGPLPDPTILDPRPGQGPPPPRRELSGRRFGH